MTLNDEPQRPLIPRRVAGLLLPANLDPATADQPQPFDRLYKSPIGFALKEVHQEAGAFYGSWQNAKVGVDQNFPGMRDWALDRQMVAVERQTLGFF